jgi:ketosteroid isomerase-like protein
MKNLYMILPLALILCFMVGCQQSKEVAEELAVDVEAEKLEVQNILNQYLSALKNKNIKTLAEIFPQDNEIVMFDGNDSRRFIGWDAIKTRYQEHFNSYEKIDVQVRDLIIKIHSSGEISWLTCVFDWDYLFKGRQGATKGLRASWVLRKKNDKWEVVQVHFSFVKVNEDQEKEDR